MAPERVVMAVFVTLSGVTPGRATGPARLRWLLPVMVLVTPGAKAIGLARVTSAKEFRLPPARVRVPVPSAPAAPTVSVPPARVVPAKVLLGLSSCRPLLALLPPARYSCAPLTTPVKATGLLPPLTVRRLVG